MKNIKKSNGSKVQAQLMTPTLQRALKLYCATLANK